LRPILNIGFRKGGNEIASEVVIVIGVNALQLRQLRWCHGRASVNAQMGLCDVLRFLAGKLWLLEMAAQRRVTVLALLDAKRANPCDRYIRWFRRGLVRALALARWWSDC